MLPFLELSLSTGAPGDSREEALPLDSDDDEPVPVPETQRDALSTDAFARKDLVYIGPSTTIPWTVPWTHGPQKGLFARRRIVAGTLLGFYTGRVYTTVAHFNAAHDSAERVRINRYAIEVGGGVIAPPILNGSAAPDLMSHPMAAINENSVSRPNARMVSVILTSDQVNCTASLTASERSAEYAAVAIYTCRDIAQDREVTTHYGPHYPRRDYTVHAACGLSRNVQPVTALGLVPLASACVMMEGSGSEDSGSDPDWDGRS